MNIDRCNYCTLEASKLLASSDICSPVYSLDDIKHSYNIHIDTIQNFLKIANCSFDDLKRGVKYAIKDGLMLKKYGTCIILYNEDMCNSNRTNWTIFHEFGHLHLKHLNDSEIEEKETNMFVAQLLMPIYSIIQISKILHGITSSDLENIFNVSAYAAKLRIEDLKKYYSSNYAPNDYDLAIWDMTKIYIMQELQDNPVIKIHRDTNTNTRTDSNNYQNTVSLGII